MSVPVHPPTENQVAEDPDGIREWVRGWQRYTGAGVVDWAPRRWPSFGEQELPIRLRLTGAAEICRAARDEDRYIKLVGRQGELTALTMATGFAGVVAGSHPQWEVLDDDDFTRLVATLRWLLDHPGSGLFIRQLPIEGVDTKWLGRNRRLVERLIAGVRGDPDLGIRSLPHLHEVALLDESLLPGMPRLFATAIEDLAHLVPSIDRVLILENKEGLYSLPPARRTIAICGAGNAVIRLAAVPWVAAAEVFYWGDLDTHGLTILDRFRRVMPQVRSVLMDVATLTKWIHLAVEEPTPATEDLHALTDDEFEVLDRLRSTGGRLEQERIPWPHVLEQLTEAGIPLGDEPSLGERQA